MLHLAKEIGGQERLRPCPNSQIPLPAETTSSRPQGDVPNRAILASAQSTMPVMSPKFGVHVDIHLQEVVVLEHQRELGLEEQREPSGDICQLRLEELSQTPGKLTEDP